MNADKHVIKEQAGVRGHLPGECPQAGLSYPIIKPSPFGRGISTYHSSLIGVCIAAGVVGPGPVALGVEEPTAAVGADLRNRFCASKETLFINISNAL